MNHRLYAAILALAALLLAPASAGALTIDAGKATIHTAGAAMQGGWNLYSDGDVGDYVRAEKDGQYELVLRAYGSPCKGVWPLAEVRVDGNAVASVTVGTKEFADYTLKFSLTAGLHTVTVAFTNDAMEGGEDRNLYLGSLELRPLSGAKELTLGKAEDVAAAAEDREKAALELAAKGVEQYRKGAATVRVVDAAGKPVAGASVKADLARHEFLFGCNIYMFDRFKTAAENDAYKKRFADLFNFATTQFYWKGYEWERGKPDYASTDKIVAWAGEHKIRLKGHPLLWGDDAGIPRWSSGQPAADVQKARVQDIVRRYAGKIEFWEVVNEPAHQTGVKIDEPYRWAREADPKASLIVNDYYVLANGCPPFLDLLKKAKAAGVPFDGIGIQAHEPRSERFPLDRVQRIFDQYAALGKPLYVTEYSPASGGEKITGSHKQGTWDEAAQAEYAERFYRVAFGHPALAGITWWDLSDNGSWLKGGGMLHADLTPKPVYNALMRLIHTEWHTLVEGKTDAEGKLAVRGFRGDYRVEVEAAGRKVVGEYRLAKDGANEWVVRVEAEPHVFLGVPEDRSGDAGGTGSIGGQVHTVRKMSPVAEVSYADYEQARRDGKIVAEEKYSGYVYFATRSWRDVRFDNASAQVEFTDRYKARVP
jgi:GH35 family endo-1,4-beta-xylanase